MNRLLMLVAAVLAFGTVYYVMAGGIRAVFWIGLLVSVIAAFGIGFAVGRMTKSCDHSGRHHMNGPT
jgi:Na+/proline symporter